jgi:hypothetical protein
MTFEQKLQFAGILAEGMKSNAISQIERRNIYNVFKNQVNDILAVDKATEKTQVAKPTVLE